MKINSQPIRARQRARFLTQDNAAEPSERALTTVVATCYLPGVSTRRMERLVETLGITRLSNSQVSVMSAELDGQVESSRTRPLDARPLHVAADALTSRSARAAAWSRCTHCSRPG